MTNWEILHNHVDPHCFLRDKCYEAAIDAMDEYAKQEAISLLKFIVSEEYEYVAGDYDGVVTLQMTPEEIYDLYIKEKEKAK